MMKLSYIGIIITNVIIFLGLNLILDIYNLSEGTAQMTREIIIYYGIMAMLIWPLSFMIANTLRASNDVKFCMLVCMYIFNVDFQNRI